LADEPAVLAKAFSFWNYVPNFDGQTLFTFVVGTIITLATFWFGYKKTIGAQEERVRAANHDLISSVVRRVAVERQAMDFGQYNLLRGAKSYRSGLPVERLIPFGDALSIVLLDIIDNNFLDQAAKTAIIALLDQSRASVPEGPDRTNERDSKEGKLREAAVLSLAIISSLVGIAASFGTKFFVTEPRWDTPQAVDFGKFLILVLALLGILGIFLVAVKNISEQWTMTRLEMNARRRRLRRLGETDDLVSKDSDKKE
jgi:hypothetical protein